jgi:hypothetical protein
VRLRDHQADELHCGPRPPADLLLLDAIDWAVLNDDHPCGRASRSSPPVALPVYLWSPDWENRDGTGVDVHCPREGPPVCEGTITLTIEGRRFGPRPFRSRAGTERGFRMSRLAFVGEDDDASGTVTLRLKRGPGRVRRVTRHLMAPSWPYDSAAVTSTDAPRRIARRGPRAAPTGPIAVSPAAATSVSANRLRRTRRNLRPDVPW